MHIQQNTTLNLIDLAITIVADAFKEYRQRWRLYTGIVLLGMGLLILIELVLIRILGAPLLVRIEPLLFRFATSSPFDFTSAIADLDLQAIGAYIALLFLLTVVEIFIINNIVIGALINVASGEASGILQAYRLRLARYFNLIGVTLVTGIMIFLPTILLCLLFCSLFFIVPQLFEGPGRLIGQIVLVFFIFLSAPFALLFGIRFALAPQLVVIEQHNAISAVWRSWRILRGWRAPFSVFSIMVLLAMGSFLLGFIAPQFERELSSIAVRNSQIPLFMLFLVSHAFGQLLNSFLFPFQCIAFTLLYRYITRNEL